MRSIGRSSRGATLVETVNTPDAIAGGTSALALGTLSLLLCWWFPFGAFLGATGVVIGLVSWLAGWGRERALFGGLLGASGLAAASLMNWAWWSRWLDG